MSGVAQPQGTVTMVFTDIEGSTRLLEALGTSAYREALAEHRRIVREACARHAGYEVDYEGDAFFYAFSSPGAAVRAVSEAMHALDSGPIRLRVGIHTGEPELDPPKYVGIDVHRAARIMSSAHGGQVVLSRETVAILPSDAFELRDLGDHHFKDIDAPERVYQLGNHDHPPLKSLYRITLPLPATPFLGREEELAQVVTLMRRDDVRLLTLTGPGGTGKTRLALEAANRAVFGFPDGVTWLPLAPVRDPAQVAPMLADALGLMEEPDRPLIETIASALQGKRALVLLDNAEHLLPAVARDIGGLLAAPGPLLLVTSRERLQLGGEHVYAVPPMSEEDAVELFLTRSAQYGRELEADPAVSELCARLDELPLALELAAARTPLFTPAQLVERLGQRLDLLKGARDADPRQQTLRAAIEWSYELLTEEEQRLFRRLSVFAGGCSYDAAEQVCGADPDTLQSLLEKSLVRRRDTELGPRYWMLETVREYAVEQLVPTGEEREARARHAAWACLLAIAGEERLGSSAQSAALAELDLELPELEVALPWQARRGDGDVALRACAALIVYFESRQIVRGSMLVEDVLDHVPGATASRCAALSCSAALLMHRGRATFARRRLDEQMTLARDLGDEQSLASALLGVGYLESGDGRHDRALEFMNEALTLFEGLGVEYRERMTHHAIGTVLRDAGRPEEAVPHFEWNIAASTRAGDDVGAAASLHSLGDLRLDLADTSAAEAAYVRALELAVRAGDGLQTRFCLGGLAAVAADRRDAERAALFWGALKLAEQEAGVPLVAHERVRYEKRLDRLELPEVEAPDLDDVLALVTGSASVSEQRAADVNE